MFFLINPNKRKAYTVVKKHTQSILRPNWKIAEINKDTISKDYSGDYVVYVQIKNNKLSKWTNDGVEVNKNGEIIKSELLENMIRIERRAD